MAVPFVSAGRPPTRNSTAVIGISHRLQRTRMKRVISRAIASMAVTAGIQRRPACAGRGKSLG
jgi:hypothetical protein